MSHFYLSESLKGQHEVIADVNSAQRTAHTAVVCVTGDTNVYGSPRQHLELSLDILMIRDGSPYTFLEILIIHDNV